jgi:hypothetical protein
MIPPKLSGAVVITTLQKHAPSSMERLWRYPLNGVAAGKTKSRA